ncbi:CCA tRNA nucleotidyltransferase [Brevundimonas sp.]|uniref:CCA tRNA nucleotidyltransferase n=1 Tax=Brevundimonas sp. TaxID=1871086 RepID=UPI003BAAE5DA
MTASVADQAWLHDRATRAVIDALEAAGGPGCVRFVGGCVRNALMGQAVDDIDMATRLLPEASVAALRAAGLKVVPTGLAHGTVTAVSGRKPHEITTLRRDVETDGRKAVVAFTDDWSEDAARRDFRLNALYADGDGQVFDPTGHGVEDVRHGRIVFVGDPGTRIEEDYLRILRFFRFYAWYGRGAPDAEGLAACAEHAPGMSRLSAERVSKELLKLLSAPRPVAAVEAMAASGVLAVILPEAGSLEALRVMAAMSEDVVLRLSTLLPVEAAGIEAAARRLRLPNAMLARLVAAAPPLDLAMSEREARATLYRVGRGAFLDRVFRAEAMTGQPGSGDGLRSLAEAWAIPRLPVGGRHVAAAGLAAGPETGRVLAAFEAGWIADDFPAEGHRERLSALVEPLLRA